ncbi:MAG: DUF1127 domain-containing protein [Pseudomonadota bacterium]
MSQIDREMLQIQRGKVKQVVLAQPLGYPPTRAVQRHEDSIATLGARLTRAAFRVGINALLTWRERARMRRRLLSFDDHMLKDIGITRADAFGEAEKPFWRV